MQKRYILDFDASSEFENIDQARMKLEALAEFARQELKLHVHGGIVAVARETEPIETWRLGSDEAYRNMTSEEGTPQARRFERALTTA